MHREVFCLSVGCAFLFIGVCVTVLLFWTTVLHLLSEMSTAGPGAPAQKIRAEKTIAALLKEWLLFPSPQLTSPAEIQDYNFTNV